MKFVSAACAQLICALDALLTLSAPAIAMPQPAKPVAPNLYSGRWYEIARTTNKMQAGCVASTTDFSSWRGGAFSVVQTKRKVTRDIDFHGAPLRAGDCNAGCRGT